jgi:hypothetical protein
MIVAGLCIMFFAGVWWCLFYLLVRGRTMASPEEYRNAVVVGYGDAGRYTDLIVKFQLDENMVMADTDVVDIFDFPVGCEVKISLYRENLGRKLPALLGTDDNVDKMSGFVRIDTPKYLESRRKHLVKSKILFGSIAMILSITSLTFIVMGVLKR